MLPSLDTSTAAVNAAAAFGVWFTRTGADQVSPPSVDLESAMSSCVPPENTPVAHTTYKLPVLESTATSGRSAPERTGWPVSGSTTGRVEALAILIGFDQVSPPSVE